MSASKLTKSAYDAIKLISLWGDECDFIPRSWVGGPPSIFVELEKYSIIFPARSGDIIYASPRIAKSIWRALTKDERVQTIIRKEFAWLIKKNKVL